MNIIFIVLIVLCATFAYQIPGVANITDIPQSVVFVLAGCLAISVLLFKKNKIAGAIMLVVGLSFVVTVLNHKASSANVLDGMLLAFVCAGMYMFARETRIKEDAFRWFLIPAWLNIIFIFFQKLFPGALPLKGYEVCGLLGNAGFTAMFLGMTTPIFIRFNKLGLPFLFTAIVFCSGFVGMMEFAVCMLYQLSKDNHTAFIASITVVAVLAGAYLKDHRGEALNRASYAAGAISGIMHHPIAGWGMGTFESVMSKVSVKDSTFFGVPFNRENSEQKFVLNHPANEFLFGWWNFGIIFPALMMMMFGHIWFNRFTCGDLTFGILLASFVVSMFFMFLPPTLFLATLALGAHDNMKEEDENARPVESNYAVV